MFPRLSGTTYRRTSPRDSRYNCIAWAANDVARWWAPEEVPGERRDRYYWPPRATRGYEPYCLVEVFEEIGYERCSESELEHGFQKVALYAAEGAWRHAARQLPSGRWTSKIGPNEDIEHESPASLCGAAYGFVYCYMRRPHSYVAIFPPPR